MLRNNIYFDLLNLLHSRCPYILYHILSAAVSFTVLHIVLLFILVYCFCIIAIVFTLSFMLSLLWYPLHPSIYSFFVYFPFICSLLYFVEYLYPFPLSPSLPLLSLSPSALPCSPLLETSYPGLMCSAFCFTSTLRVIKKRKETGHISSISQHLCFVHLCGCVCVCVRICAFARMCACVCVQARVSLCVCLCVCMCVLAR